MRGKKGSNRVGNWLTKGRKVRKKVRQERRDGNNGNYSKGEGRRRRVQKQGRKVKRE